MFKRLSIVTVAWLVTAPVLANPDKDGVYILTQPERTMAQVEKAYAQMPPLHYTPRADRWKKLPRTAAILHQGGELHIVMLGDSIVNDTSCSRWDDVLRPRYPRAKIVRTTVVRGGTGCWWYHEAGRVKKYVIPLRPDLFIIGGISQRDDVDSIRDTIRQVRAARPCDVLLMTGAFGPVDPRDPKQWTPTIDTNGHDYRARLQRLARSEHGAFLDMTGAWGQYIRTSGKPLDWFKRDPIHANERGEQILGRILVRYLSP